MRIYINDAGWSKVEVINFPAHRDYVNHKSKFNKMSGFRPVWAVCLLAVSLAILCARLLRESLLESLFEFALNGGTDVRRG